MTETKKTKRKRQTRRLRYTAMGAVKRAVVTQKRESSGWNGAESTPPMAYCTVFMRARISLLLCCFGVIFRVCCTPLCYPV